MLIKLFFTQNNRDNGCNVLDRDDHGGRRAGLASIASLNQVVAPRGHNFGVGEQVIRGPKADSRGGVLGERAASPSPSARGSGERRKLGYVMVGRFALIPGLLR